MKKVWIEVDNRNKQFFTDAIESGVDAFFITRKELMPEISSLSRTAVYHKENLPEDIRFFVIKGKEDEEEAAALPASLALIIVAEDWKVIPMENLIARRKNLFLLVDNLQDAVDATAILEKGVDGVYISGCPDVEKLKILKKIKSEKGSISLGQGEILSIRRYPPGDRVCIDTIINMRNGEGMLIGDFSTGMVLVNSESHENPYVLPRPFRINAGAVHSYLMTTEGRTKYLSDLKSGDEVLIVNHRGETSITVTGRVKIERRPMLHIGIKGKQGTFGAVVQNAETIRLVTPEGESKSVVTIEKGDRVVIFEEEGARHFGYKIEETIWEK